MQKRFRGKSDNARYTRRHMTSIIIKIFGTFLEKVEKAKVRIRTGVVMLCRHLRGRSATLARQHYPTLHQSDLNLYRLRATLAAKTLQRFHPL
jgi:hypothetical protein